MARNAILYLRLQDVVSQLVQLKWQKGSKGECV